MGENANGVPEGALVWIFGYGSLIWRPDFPAIARQPARIRGWKRRFWQGSTDHRGVPEAPGRVVTLLPAPPTSWCHGMAYALPPDGSHAVLAHLDHRERGGYERHRVELHFESGEREGPAGGRAQGLLYIATPANPNWLGPAPLERIARQIARSRGPSGHNLEYLLRLAESLRAMGATDPHVEALVHLVHREPGPQSLRSSSRSSPSCEGPLPPGPIIPPIIPR